MLASFANAADVQQGRVYSALAHAIKNAPVPFVLPAAVVEGLEGKSPELRVGRDLQPQVERAVRRVLAHSARPIACFAVIRFAVALRGAHAENLDNEYSDMARDQMRAFGNERVTTCLLNAQLHESAVAAYTPGEFGIYW